ncbi:hypothetical protein OGAPHI_005000 [Ogataea philodendri]|uniref:phosphoserine phosphatase n=1 Tax=Ogataea philodendri TaxID=1378263 RepID=A0A9P8P2Q0_9ASCO|nr:uncharacterized protein OGAPHI_005000 [Ogataea philodendri]KAH3663599.1 hypothetical protein OGAPHI_005000 [Ogataea philodendri]
MSYIITAIAAKELPSDIQTTIESHLIGQEVKFVKSSVLAAGKAVDFFVDVENADNVSKKIKLINIPQVDLAFQKDSDARKNKKLAVFDMDSTLIYQEVIELIAAQAGVEDEVARITNLAMNGEIDFQESFRRRVNLLKGIPSADLWAKLKPQLNLTNGTKQLCATLKKNGCVLAVCSGGFLPLAEHVKELLGLDYAFANQLKTQVVDGTEVLSGEPAGEIVDGNKKKAVLLELAAKHGVSLANSVAVGDGANDLLMMGAAGLGLAWNAKPKVQLEADCRLNTDSLADALYIFGYTDKELE